MKIKKGQQFDVEITDVVFGGRGLVRLDGMAVFVDQAVPGDRVNIRIYKKKKNYAEARVVDLIESSPLRGPVSTTPTDDRSRGPSWKVAHPANIKQRTENANFMIEPTSPCIILRGLCSIKIQTPFRFLRVFVPL